MQETDWEMIITEMKCLYTNYLAGSHCRLPFYMLCLWISQTIQPFPRLRMKCWTRLRMVWSYKAGLMLYVHIFISSCGWTEICISQTRYGQCCHRGCEIQRPGRIYWLCPLCQRNVKALMVLHAFRSSPIIFMFGNYLLGHQLWSIFAIDINWKSLGIGLGSD